MSENEKDLANSLATYRTVKKYDTIRRTFNLTEEDDDWIRTYPFAIAQSLLVDFGDDAITIAKLILAFNEKIVNSNLCEPAYNG